MLMILLPVGVALCVVPVCSGPDSLSESSLCINPDLLTRRLIFSYLCLVAVFAHCNFSQLCAWPKTLQAVLVGSIFLCFTYLCQYRLTSLITENIGKFGYG
ncbi:unnamed protein product [Anisakis simplex]|uniref:Secreted protein n=1 Tax=Anisakis simplex TaxID=6269 RepID=A0A0M3JID0_ANISI|nr:unnamed protein product [Anisakis simplex]VDK28650.1 unnamed protein product [Anisakis simplex]